MIEVTEREWLMIRSMKFETMDDFERQLYDFKILFAYHSGKIENEQITYHDTRDIFESGRITNYTGNLKTLLEIENQKNCYEFLKPSILKKTRMDIELIKKVHKMLTRGTYDDHRYHINFERPGEFKKHNYVTGKYEVGSAPEQVEKNLRDLLSELDEYEGEDHFTAGIYFHAVFENIHPFADGNGRVGRTLMNYYFMIHDIAPVVIHEKNRKKYYHALEVFDEEESLEALADFIEQEQEQTWNPQMHNRERKCSLQDFLENDEHQPETGKKDEEELEFE